VSFQKCARPHAQWLSVNGWLPVTPKPAKEMYSNALGIAHDAATGTAALPTDVLPGGLAPPNWISPTFNHTASQKVQIKPGETIDN
jgi:hypothetical protein